MKSLLFFFSVFFLVGCNSNKKKSAVQKKLDGYFTNSSNVNLDKEARLKFIDSAEQIIQKSNENDSIKIKNYFKLANRYFIVLDYVNYKRSINKILEIAKSNNDSLSTAKAEYYLGDYYFFNSKNDSAYYYYLAAEKKYKTLNNKPNLATTILHKAYILLYEKDFLGSESETIKVLNIAKEIRDESLIYECFVNLGSSLSGLGNYEKALEYHKKALLQIKEINDENYKPLLQAQTINNIGFVYLGIKKNQEAYQVFSEGLKIKNLKEIQPVLYASLLDNYAYSAFKINKIRGLNDFNEALELRDAIDDIHGKITSRIHLTEYYLSQKDTLKAIELNSEANVLAKKANYNEEVLVTLDFFTKLIPKDGLSYAKAYITLNDSLQNQERATRNKLARIAFETDEIILQKEELSYQKKIILLASIFLISIVVLLYIILYQRGKQKELLFEQEQQKVNEEIYTLMLKKQNEIDEAREVEKTKIALELHDNVLNKLASTRLNLFALTKRQDEETIKKAVDQINGIINIESEIRIISHELAKEDFLNKSNFKKLLEELISNQSQIYSLPCDSDFSQDEALESINILVKLHLYRIIQEALNNINTHAQATKITIKIAVENKKLKLSIADNGVGFKVTKVKKGIGIKNMYKRVATIDGKIEILSKKDKGTIINIMVRL